MAKSEILKELANNIVSLEVALSRLMVIASDLGDTVLFDWAKYELNGYDEHEKIPQYRHLGDFMIRYTGINGRFQMTNQPMPLHFFTEEEINGFSNNIFTQGIRVAEDFASSKEIGRDITYLAGSIKRRTGIQCTSIQIIFSTEAFRSLLNSVRTKLLEVFIKLDSEFGNLDNLDVTPDKGNMKEIQTYIEKIIYSDDSIRIGDGNSVSKSNFEAR